MLKFNSVLIRYGELFLKGHNKNFFESALINNIKTALKGIDCTFVRAQCRYFVENIAEGDFGEVLARLKRVIGLNSLSPCVKVKTDIEEIGCMAVGVVPTSGTFRVSVNRADQKVKTTSTEIAKTLGARILEAHKGLKVDLFKYDFELSVDIRENGFTYLFCERIPCEGGLPVGTGGVATLLISGGIDSPVAGYKMVKRGLKLVAVHFHSFPYTGELALQKVKDLTKLLARYAGPIKLCVVPFAEVQEAIHTHCREDFMITIMRRIMMRVAETIAKSNGAGALITGESLGQVASQTMESITVTNSVVSLPVFRPLIGSDKDEIIAVSQKIGAYDISILPYEDCCTVFLPKNPIIKPKLEEAERQEALLPMEELIKNAVEKTEFFVIE